MGPVGVYRLTSSDCKAGTEFGTEFLVYRAKTCKICASESVEGRTHHLRKQLFRKPLRIAFSQDIDRRRGASGAEGYRFEPCRGYSYGART